MESEQACANTSSLGKERLLRILGVTFGVAVGIGGTIGIGILRIPGNVAALLGHSGLIMGVWIVSDCMLSPVRIPTLSWAQCCRLMADRTFMLVGHMESSVDFWSAGAIGSSGRVPWHIWR